MKVYVVHEEDSVTKSIPTMFVSQEDAAKYAEFYKLEEYWVDELEVFSWAEYENLFIVR